MSDSRAIALDRVRHMIEAAESIATYANRGRDGFDADPAVQDAALYGIVVRGEAAKAVIKADTFLADELFGS